MHEHDYLRTDIFCNNTINVSVHTHLVSGVLHGQFLIIHISFPAGLREAAPQRFPLVKLSHLQGLARRVNLLRFAKNPHILLFYFNLTFFFFHDLYFQDLSCEKKQEVKRSSAVTGYVAQPSVEQHLTLCSYFASFKPFHAVSLSLGLHQTLCEFNVLTL